MTDPFQDALSRHLDFMDARDAKMLGVSWQYILEEESKRVEAVTRLVAAVRQRLPRAYVSPQLRVALSHTDAARQYRDGTVLYTASPQQVVNDYLAMKLQPYIGTARRSSSPPWQLVTRDGTPNMAGW